ncbi:MAG: hypothetical protein AAFQ51_09090 [Pseudomonadota bacterium]
MAKLFDPLNIRGVTLRNRVGLSPMSMYSAKDGYSGPFEPIHYGARSLGGAGLVMTGTVAVSPEGRITPADPGLWEDDQVAPLAAVADAIRQGGGVPGIQIGHAGRKASTTVPWRGGDPKSDGRSLTYAEGAWQTVGPMAEPYGGNKTHVPAALAEAQIERIITAFSDAARRADQAGFEVLEIHGAHGYLLHSFYSPITNHRHDAWGGGQTGRLRLARDVIRAVRAAWPSEKPLGLRFAMDDFHEGGWAPEDGIALARMALGEGVDFLDPMSFGGIAEGGAPDWGRNFTHDHAKALKTALPQAVILGSAQTSPDFVTDPHAVNALASDGSFDVILLGRQLLADPHWPAKAANELGDDRLLLPPNYEHWLTGRHKAQAIQAAA